MNLSKFSAFLKVLSIIPVAVGILTIAEALMPMQKIETIVVSKHDSFRIKTGTTTYSIYFEKLNDQFTKSIYNSLSEGAKVVVTATYFHKEIREIKRVSDGRIFTNDTFEPFYQYIFALVFVLCGFSWFNTGELGKRNANLLAFGIVLSLVDAIRMIYLNFS